MVKPLKRTLVKRKNLFYILCIFVSLSIILSVEGSRSLQQVNLR